MCTSFKQALLDGEMDFSSDSSQTFKIALYDSSATLDATTTAYTASGEVSGTGYSAGGVTDPAVAVLNFGSDITSTNGDFTVQFPAAAAATAILRLA
jgi:PKD repeat protein